MEPASCGRPSAVEGDCSGPTDFAGPSCHAPECPVCWECFDLNQHAPRLIACGHTICEKCAGNLPLTKDFFGKRCISCPECRCLVVWRGPGSLPKNFALLRIVREMMPAGKPARASRPDLHALSRHVETGSMLTHISNLASIISVMFGVLLGMFVLIPLCFVYIAVGWMIAALSVFAFALLTAAAVGFGTAGGFSFFSCQICKLFKGPL